MELDNASPRLAILATDPARGDLLARACRAALPDAQVEIVRDMVDLIIRAAAGSTDVVVVDGSTGDALPEEGVTAGSRSFIFISPWRGNPARGTGRAP